MIKKVLTIIILSLFWNISVYAETKKKYEGKNLKEEKELSCKYNPKCKNFPKVKKIKGIKYSFPHYCIKITSSSFTPASDTAPTNSTKMMHTRFPELLYM